jgi:DNA polymerase V
MRTHEPVFGLLDCNSFYASCKRVFWPDLAKTPIVVLSNNDGCVIARSYDAKPFMKMGAPYYQIKEMLRREGIMAFSSNSCPARLRGEDRRRKHGGCPKLFWRPDD